MSEKHGGTLGEENTIKEPGNRILRRISERGTPRSWLKWSFEISVLIKHNSIQENIMDKSCSTQGRQRRKYQKLQKKLFDVLGVGVNNIETFHKRVRLEGINWMHLAKRRGLVRVLVNTVIKLHIPSIFCVGQRQSVSQ